PMCAGQRSYFNRVVGVAPQFSGMHSWTIRRGGTMFTSTDIVQRAKVAVVGTAAATALFGDMDPVGQSLTIRTEPFRIVAVTESKVEDQADSVFVPYTALQDLRGVTSLDTITVAAEQAGEASRIAADIAPLLRTR